MDSDISDMQYLIYSLSIHCMIMIGAISLNDVGLIFDFISAFGLTLLMYILPATFLLQTMSKFQKKMHRDTFETKLYKFIAYVMFAFGLISLALGVRVCYYNITKK